MARFATNKYQGGVLTSTLARFARPKGANLLDRTQPYFDWQDKRRQTQLWPYSRSLDGCPEPITKIRNDSGQTAEGINFGSQDYLSLSSHLSIQQAAINALYEFGPHSAGSPCFVGNTKLSLELETALAEMLHMDHVVLFPTGWASGFGAIVGLVRPYDHIVMDELAHACLQQGASAATSNIVRYNHLDLDAVKSHLKEIRSQDTENGILVITEGLFSMDSDVPDIAKLQDICHEYGATLFVDVAHDFGALGPGGTGSLGIQEMLGKVDLVMGSFSKTFASNGGFLATNSPAVKQFVKFYGGPQ